MQSHLSCKILLALLTLGALAFNVRAVVTDLASMEEHTRQLNEKGIQMIRLIERIVLEAGKMRRNETPKRNDYLLLAQTLSAVYSQQATVFNNWINECWQYDMEYPKPQPKDRSLEFRDSPAQGRETPAPWTYLYCFFEAMEQFVSVGRAGKQPLDNIIKRGRVNKEILSELSRLDSEFMRYYWDQWRYNKKMGALSRRHGGGAVDE